jgi:hypothetical protein
MEKAGKKPKRTAAAGQGQRQPTVHVVKEAIHLLPSVHTKQRIDDMMEGIRIGQKRPSPKSGPAIEILRRLFPPEGKPPQSKVSDFEIERDYLAECDRLKIPPKDRAGRTQLMRCAGRKD